MPQAAALEPDGLVVVVALALAVDRGDVAAVLPVEQVALLPEGHTVVQKLMAVEVSVRGKDLFGHMSYSFPCAAVRRTAARIVLFGSILLRFAGLVKTTGLFFCNLLDFFRR